MPKVGASIVSAIAWKLFCSARRTRRSVTFLWQLYVGQCLFLPRVVSIYLISEKHMDVRVVLSMSTHNYYIGCLE